MVWVPCMLLNVELCTEAATGRSLCCEPTAESDIWAPSSANRAWGAAPSPSPRGTSGWRAQLCWVLCPCSDQLTLLGMETLTWHRHTQQVGNQLICLNLQPSLSLVVFSDETLQFLQFSSFIFPSVPCVTCSKLRLGHHRHIFIHPVALIHITPPTLAEFLSLIHTQRKWISCCTQECVSHHCSWLDSMQNAVCSYPRAPFWQALSWHCNCITATLVFKLNQNFKVLIHCDVDQWECNWNSRMDFNYTKIMFPIFNMLG